MPDREELADVSDGAQVVDGVSAPTEKELAAVAELSPHELQEAIDAHVEEVSIHDGRDS